MQVSGLSNPVMPTKSPGNEGQAMKIRMLKYAKVAVTQSDYDEEICLINSDKEDAVHYSNIKGC